MNEDLKFIKLEQSIEAEVEKELLEYLMRFQYSLLKKTKSSKSQKLVMVQDFMTMQGV